MSDNASDSSSSSSLFWAALAATVNAVPMPSFVPPTAGPLSYVPPQYAGAAGAGAGAGAGAAAGVADGAGVVPTAPAKKKLFYPDGTPKKRDPAPELEMFGHLERKRQRPAATEDGLLQVTEAYLMGLGRKVAELKALAEQKAQTEL